MVVRGAADVASLLVDGRDILGTVTQLNDKQFALTEETHALGDAYVEHSFTGVRRAEITQEGFYDDAANSAHAALGQHTTGSTVLGPGNSTRVLTYQAEGTATGANFKGMTAVQIDYAVEPGRAVFHKAKATYWSNGRFDQGKVLQTFRATAGTSAEVGAAVQRVDASGGAVTTSTTGGGAGYFQMSAFTSAALATAVQSRIQHSSDNITYADLITFTSATAAPFAQRATVSGGVEAYLRANTSYQGGASATITAFWGFARY